MKVHLLSAYNEPTPNYGPEWLKHHTSSPSPHTLVEAPKDADLILFVETFASLDPFFLDVILHPVYRAFRSKCVLYHISDIPFTLCRTVSPSVVVSQPGLQHRRSFHYMARRRDNYELPSSTESRDHLPHLFSFVGAVETHPVRKEILRLKHPAALLKDTSEQRSDLMSPADRAVFQRDFVESVLSSHFVLCPRGYGPSSMRLFEVMQLGRVPVIISDDWVPVPGVAWDTFAVFVREDSVSSIPDLLESLVPNAKFMGENAREAWEVHFAPAHAFHQLVSTAASLLHSPYGIRETILDALPLVHPRFWRKLTGYFRRRIQRSNR
ncbi:exostosin family protein [Verrucomicrobium sp. BvORR034]|uniref:exostosin domain-containing protein n=1 Tax=Verrucomicrobium sp. BvORR034 TaxID=1396418 RepID=UPI00067922E8|nr:exostosin family protein [Verrucomicrobium sp. BvORR034]